MCFVEAERVSSSLCLVLGFVNNFTLKFCIRKYPFVRITWILCALGFSSDEAARWGRLINITHFPRHLRSFPFSSLQSRESISTMQWQQVFSQITKPRHSLITASSPKYFSTIHMNPCFMLQMSSILCIFHIFFFVGGDGTKYYFLMAYIFMIFMINICSTFWWLFLLACIMWMRAKRVAFSPPLLMLALTREGDDDDDDEMKNVSTSKHASYHIMLLSAFYGN